MQETISLSMPNSLDPALRSLHGLFAQLLPDVTVVMGGGTVLAARWHHRESTDIDLFVSPSTMHVLTSEKLLVVQGLLTRLQGIGQANFNSVSGFLSGQVNDTPFSLAATEFVSENREGSDTIEGTNFYAAANEEIFSGKIKGRLHRFESQSIRVPIRDLYDIVVAAKLAPGVISQVLEGITPKGRSVIAADLRSLPDNLHEQDPKPLLNPKYRVELTGLAKAIAPAIEAGDESLLPQTTATAKSTLSGFKP